MAHVDVLIVGAGLSGIGAGYRLQTRHPGRSYAILEGRDAIGGTWDLFRYPGIRSDSDMFTLGFPFRPWRDPKAIADGPSILAYLRETAAEFGIDRHIRFGRRVVAASWSSAEARWTVEARTAEGTETWTCAFLYLCSGYYSYDRGHTPEWPGFDEYAGLVVHPQEWPEDLDARGRRVVVIGSGATAMTLVPALAAQGAQVTMLQRSPTWVVSLPDTDGIADLLRKVPLVGHHAARWKAVLLTQAFYQLCRRAPGVARRMLLARLERQVGRAAVAEHFTPRYDPWDQRLCVVPNSDLFRAMRAGTATVVTDRIARFTPGGVALESGGELAADVVVTATGLNLLALGGIRLSVDGDEVKPGQRFAYRGCMLSGVPNFAMCVGYVNASWTLRADLTSRYVCRLLAHMDAGGHAVAVPRVADESDGRPLLELTSGYVQRSIDLLPKQGSRAPWVIRQNYVVDLVSTGFGDVREDMEFRPAVAAG